MASVSATPPGGRPAGGCPAAQSRRRSRAANPTGPRRPPGGPRGRRGAPGSAARHGSATRSSAAWRASGRGSQPILERHAKSAAEPLRDRGAVAGGLWLGEELPLDEWEARVEERTPAHDRGVLAVAHDSPRRDRHVGHVPLAGEQAAKAELAVLDHGSTGRLDPNLVPEPGQGTLLQAPAAEAQAVALDVMAELG